MNIIKKPIIKFVLVFLVILLIIVPQQVNAAKLVLNVNPYCQQNSNWCWAAASQSIIEYHRKWETQCQVYKWGKNTTSCTGNEQLSMSGYSALFQRAGLSPGTYASYAFNFSSIKGQINAYKPLIGRMEWKSNGGGHAFIVRGYDDTSTLVHWIYIGNCGELKTEHRISSYGALADNATWKWTHTQYGMW